MKLEFDYHLPAFMRERAANHGVHLAEVIPVIVDVEDGAAGWEATLMSPFIPDRVVDDCGLPLGAALEDHALRIVAERGLL